MPQWVFFKEIAEKNCLIFALARASSNCSYGGFTLILHIINLPCAAVKFVKWLHHLHVVITGDSAKIEN